MIIKTIKLSDFNLCDFSNVQKSTFLSDGNVYYLSTQVEHGVVSISYLEDVGMESNNVFYLVPENVKLPIHVLNLRYISTVSTSFGNLYLFSNIQSF